MALSRRDYHVLSVFIAVCLAGTDVCAQRDACGADLGAFVPSPYNSSRLHCRPVWSSFIVRYSWNQDNITSIVLSAIYTSGWIAIGFSNDGKMVGSSAMVGWIDDQGRAYIKQYYLSGQTSSEVKVDDRKLLTTDIPPAVVLFGDNIYLAFQVKIFPPIDQQPVIFAFSMRSPNKFRLTEHDEKTTISFDFLSGDSVSTSYYPSHLKRNHGELSMLGWGVLLPLGATVARYLRHRDPLWYYLHVLIQFAGFILGLAGAVAGIALYNRIHSNFTIHRGLGISVLAIASLQVPEKVRRKIQKTSEPNPSGPSPGPGEGLRKNSEDVRAKSQGTSGLNLRVRPDQVPEKVREKTRKTSTPNPGGRPGQTLEGIRGKSPRRKIPEDLWVKPRKL